MAPGTEHNQLLPAGPTSLKKYGSLEEAIHSGMEPPHLSTSGVPTLTFDLDVQKGKLWVVDAALEVLLSLLTPHPSPYPHSHIPHPHSSQVVVSALKEVWECVLAVASRDEVVGTLQPVLASIQSAW